MYGMTAGHVVTELLAYQRSPNTETEQDQDIEGRICEYNIVGEILDQNLLPGVTAGQARPSHDWALFEVEIPRPNTVVSDSDQQDARHILSAARPSFTEGLSDPVVLLKNTGRTLRGELSDQSARIWLSQEEEFVDAYMLELDEGNGTLTHVFPLTILPPQKVTKILAQVTLRKASLADTTGASRV